MQESDRFIQIVEHHGGGDFPFLLLRKQIMQTKIICLKKLGDFFFSYWIGAAFYFVQKHIFTVYFLAQNRNIEWDSILLNKTELLKEIEDKAPNPCSKLLSAHPQHGDIATDRVCHP